MALAGLFDFQNFAAFVGSAFGAGAVGQLALVAVGALGESGAGDGVVGAAGGGAPFGVAALWIRHDRFLSVPGRSGQYGRGRAKVRQKPGVICVTNQADHQGRSIFSGAKAHVLTRSNGTAEAVP